MLVLVNIMVAVEEEWAAVITMEEGRMVDLGEAVLAFIMAISRISITRWT